MAGVWVTAGAPLDTGDGWRVWYSWPAGEFTPATPRVRTTGGQAKQVIEGPWDPKPAPKGSSRQMGVRELRIRDPEPGALYEVTVPERGKPLFWRTLPKQLPQQGISLLIGSCFWINDDRDGFYSAAVQELVQREKPAFKVLMGDQIYVDVWPPAPWKDLRKELAAKYERYWGDVPYRELLAACPTFVSCDDHEFWNDFPEPQMHVPFSWERFAPDNGVALAELYDAYQTALNPGGKRWCTIDVPPISFFIADTRSHRTRDSAPNPSLMPEAQWRDLEAWAAKLKGPGVLILPQPLLKAGGSKTDRTLVDFKEADRLAAVFEGAMGGKTGDGKPHDIMILTGDIHTGRVSSAEIVGLPGQIYELVASPASMVTPWLPPWGHSPSELPDRLTINKRVWVMTGHRRLTPTVDNNIGLIKIAPGRNGRFRFTLQLWRVRPFVGIARRILGRKPGKGAQPIHEPLELELR
jgi:hypothetical protein